MAISQSLDKIQHNKKNSKKKKEDHKTTPSLTDTS